MTLNINYVIGSPLGKVFKNELYQYLQRRKPVLKIVTKLDPSMVAHHSGQVSLSWMPSLENRVRSPQVKRQTTQKANIECV